jgi:hypothetical protein
MEEPAMPVGPFHHRRDGEFSIQRVHFAFLFWHGAILMRDWRDWQLARALCPCVNWKAVGHGGVLSAHKVHTDRPNPKNRCQFAPVIWNPGQHRTASISPAIARTATSLALESRMPQPAIFHVCIASGRNHRPPAQSANRAHYCIISSGGIGPQRFAAFGPFGHVFGHCGLSRCHGRGSK